jgi:hypothetical protein
VSAIKNNNYSIFIPIVAIWLWGLRNDYLFYNLLQFLTFVLYWFPTKNLDRSWTIGQTGRNFFSAEDYTNMSYYTPTCRVIALFMFVWPYVHPHILCTQLVICLLWHFIHIWYLDWPWSEHAHNIPISRMVDFCESYSPFHVWLTIRPSAHLVYATSHLSFVAFYSYLVSWLAMIWAWTYYTDFTDGWVVWEL